MKAATGIVFFHYGAFGGSTRRFTNLFRELDQRHPRKVFYFVNYEFLRQLEALFPDLPFDRIIAVTGDPKATFQVDQTYGGGGKTRVDPEIKASQVSVFRKLYWWLKQRTQQKKIFNRIDESRKALGITVFMGVYSGILPLYFYLNGKKRPAIIFSDMDTWFYDVHRNRAKMWFAQYSSFNFGLQRSDLVDFLSPFILEGVRDRGVDVSDDRARITACSFTNYEKCVPGKKDNMVVSFASRLDPDKNPLLFLEAVQRLYKDFPEAHFYLMGDGALLPEVEGFKKKHGLEERVHTGFQKDPASILGVSSIFVSIQTVNNYPSQSLLEAMATGNTIVATDVGETRWLVDDTCGTLISLDTKELEDALRILIKNPQKCLEKGLKAREKAIKEHTLEKAADYYESLFDEALLLNVD